MANYKLITATPTDANTSFKAFTAGGTNTVVSSIVAADSSTSTLEALIKKSGSATIIEVAHVQVQVDKPQELLTAPLALEANDELYVRTSRAGAKFVISYVEESTIANGTAISGLVDVDTTGVVDGDGLVYNGLNQQWEPGTVASGSTAINDLTDVISTSPTAGDVLTYSQGSGKWIESQALNELTLLLKYGTSKLLTSEATNLDQTKGFMKLEPTAATLRVNNTGVEINETSPGDIGFVVGTDATGSTAYTAIHVDGSTTASLADILIKPGSLLKFEDGTYNLWLRRPTTLTGDLVVMMPNKSGTLVTEDEIPTLVTAFTDVTSAGSGAIITDAERTKLTGIETGATADQTDAEIKTAYENNTNTNAFTDAEKSKLTAIASGATVNSPDSILLSRAYHTGTQTASTISDFTTRVETIRDAVRNPYDVADLVTDFNVEIDGSVSVASNKITDVLGDALAAKDNANAKKMLGFHTGSGICVLRGMVNANNSITGASAGSPLWLGASGAFSATAPTTANEYSRIMGYYVGTGQGGEVLVYFDPSKDWVQIDS
jgi:hypothetical protein